MSRAAPDRCASVVCRKDPVLARRKPSSYRTKRPALPRSFAETRAARSCGPPGVLANRRPHARVRETAAQDCGQRLLQLCVGRLRILIERRLRGQDHAAEAITALRGLLVNERLLDRMGLRRRAEALERSDLGAGDARDRRHTRADRAAAADDHRTGSALTKAATEFRSA